MDAALAAQALFIAGAALLAGLGSLHLVLTFFSTKFDPRDAATASAMRATTPRITRATTVWRCWIGFNASHSLGAMLFGTVYLLLAVVHMAWLRESGALAWLAVAGSAAYLLLARRYWFRTPFIGMLAATACFAGGAALLSA